MLPQIKHATLWFAQRLDAVLQAGPRLWTKEYNHDIYKELEREVQALKDAMEMGIGVQESCFRIGSCALMLAFNDYKGIGSGLVKAGQTRGPAIPKKEIPRRRN